MELTFNLPTFLVQLLNFFILLTALKMILYEPMLKAISDRQAKVQGTLSEAESVNAQAQSLKKEYEAKLAAAQQEASAIVQQATQNGEKQRTEIIDEAKQEAQHLLEKGRTELSRERQQALAEIQGRVVNLSVDMAARLFKESLTADQHKKLVDSFVKKAEKIRVG